MSLPSAGPPDSWFPDRAAPPAGAVKFLLARHDPALGPLLQLASGEGHWLLALARAGRTVTGIHSSRTTLARARRRIDQEPPEVAARVTLECSDMRDFDFPGGAGAVALVSSALQLLATKEERRDALRCARDALRPGGVLVVDVRRSPTGLFPPAGFRVLSHEGPMDDPETGRSLWRETRLGRERGVDRLLVRHVWRDQDGRVVRESGVDLADPGTDAFREEIGLAGFVEREAFGGYDGAAYEPAGRRGRLIVVAVPGP